MVKTTKHEGGDDISSEKESDSDSAEGGNKL